MSSSIRIGLLSLLLSGGLFASLGCVPPAGSSDGGAASPSSSAAANPEASQTVTATPPIESEAVDPLKSDDDLLGTVSIESGKSNIVQAVNKKDGRIRVRTNLQLNKIKGDVVVPENLAEAYSSCTDCQSFAVAVQINVYERGASVIAPRNTARAINDNCVRCVTIARAYQYVIPVDDVDLLPPEVDRLVRAINKEAHYFDKIKDFDDVDPVEIQSRLNGVLSQFAELDMYLELATAERSEPGETEKQSTPGPDGTPTATPATSTATPTPTPTPTSTPTSTSTPTPTPVTPTPTSTQAIATETATATTGP